MASSGGEHKVLLRGVLEVQGEANNSGGKAIWEHRLFVLVEVRYGKQCEAKFEDECVHCVRQSVPVVCLEVLMGGPPSGCWLRCYNPNRTGIEVDPIPLIASAAAVEPSPH